MRKVEKYKSCRSDDFMELCKNGEYIAVLYLLSRLEITKKLLDDGLFGACEGGHKNLALLIMEKGASG